MVPMRSRDEIVSLPAGQSLRVTPEHKVTSVPYTNCFKIKAFFFSTFYDGCLIVIDCCPVHQDFWRLAHATINPFQFLQRLKEIIAKSNVCDAILFSSSRICSETFKKLKPLLISKITNIFTEINAHEYMCYSQ